MDFAEVEQLQVTGQWRAAGELLAGLARQLEAAGAELLVLCTNTMHKVADQVEAAVGSPWCTWPTPPQQRYGGPG